MLVAVVSADIGKYARNNMRRNKECKTSRMWALVSMLMLTVLLSACTSAPDEHDLTGGGATHAERYGCACQHAVGNREVSEFP